MRIAVGSLNPVKLEAVRLAFEEMWPEKEWILEGMHIPSGVSDQPMSDEETIRGARNRARGAIDALKTDFGIGIEGGIQRIDGEYYDSGWVVVVDAHAFEGIGSSIRMRIPESIMERISNGEELGTAIDQIFHKENAKQNAGFFGLMTNHHIDRTHGYKDGIISALSCFFHKELFIPLRV